jgi:hypothetical protein
MQKGTFEISLFIGFFLINQYWGVRSKEAKVEKVEMYAKKEEAHDFGHEGP